jgi:hypothetical protein
MQNFLSQLRADPRYRSSLVVFMVENSLSENVVTYFWNYVSRFSPIWSVDGENKQGRKEFGLRTTNELKRTSVIMLYKMMFNGTLRFEHKLIGLPSTLELLKTQLHNMLIESEVKGGKNSYKISGKGMGAPDDVAMCLMIGVANQQKVSLTKVFADMIPSQYKPTCITEELI